jgi:hypothetical protein
VQVNDGLYAEVPLWCASGPIARRWIDLVCLEASVGRLPQEVLLEGFYRSECSEAVQVGRVSVSVPRPYRSDVYMCSKSCRLCLTVVY